MMRRAWLAFVLLSLAVTGLPATLLAQTPPYQRHALELGANTHGDKAVAPVSSALDIGSGAFTIEVWIYWRGGGERTPIMGKARNANGEIRNISFALELETDGRARFTQTTGAASSEAAVLSAEPIPRHAWTHLAGIRDGTRLRLLVNGQSVGSVPAPAGPGTSTMPFALGPPPGGGVGGGSPIVLRQARVWGRALSAATIAAQSGRYLDGTEPGLRAYWPLDDGQFSRTARDLGPNALTLSVESGFDDRDGPRWVRTAWLDLGPHFVISQQVDVRPPDCYTGDIAQACMATPVLIDFDDDGDLDVVSTGTTQNWQPAPMIALRNDGAGRFTEATADVFGTPPPRLIAAFDVKAVDVDGDTRTDVLACDGGPDTPEAPGSQTRLFLQRNGGRLVDATARLPQVVGFTYSCAVAQRPGLGVVHIYLGNGVGPYSPIGPRLYVKNDTGRFVDRSGRLPEIAGLGSIFVDVDRDGHEDLVVLGNADAATGSPDRVLLNDGTGRFTEVPNAFPARVPGFDSGHLMRSADFDGDGWPDLVFVIFKVGTDIYDRLRLLLNNRDGTFRDASAGIPHPGNRVRYNGVGWPVVADFNGDGRPDILAPAGVHPWLFLNVGNAKFIDASELVPMELPPTWPLAGDLNGDGKVDLFGAGGNAFYIVTNRKSYPIERLLAEDVTIEAIDARATEAGVTPGRFRVSRTGSTAEPLIVFYTVGGTATAGTDYAGLPGSVRIPAGASSVTIPITPMNDARVEGTETVVLTLAARSTYRVVAPASATVRIVSDE